MQLFKNRQEAGRQLATKLKDFSLKPDLVIGIPRGGIPLAYEVAMELNVPLDIFLTRKLKLPDEPNIAFGAIATKGVKVLNKNLIKGLKIPENIVKNIVREEISELEKMEIYYRGNSPLPVFLNKAVIIVDDGLATGITMKVVVEAIKKLSPSYLLVAVPIASFMVYDEINKIVDKLVCLSKTEYLYRVVNSYIEFPPVTDQDVRDYLNRFKKLKKIL